jgi:tetratricopeptide (TPR) repeat protein
VNAGEPRVARYRIDADQVLHFQLQRPAHPDQPETQLRIENPLTNVQNLILKEVEAERLERLIASGTLSTDARDQAARDMVPLLDELGQREKALAVLRGLQAGRRAPDAGLLNSMAIIVEKLGDQEEACRLYEQAAAANDEWSGPLFNLALNLRRRRKTQAAIRAVERAIEREDVAPLRTLRALLATEANDEATRQASLNAAGKLWPRLHGMLDWTLYWHNVWGHETGDDAAVQAVEAERRRRNTQPNSMGDDGELPATEPGR